MVHELTVQSVKLKTTIFTPPAKLINTNELTAAIGMSYRKAGAMLPEILLGQKVPDVIKNIPEAIFIAAGENLATVIREYVYRDDDEITDDALITSRLGYEHNK